MAVVADVHRPPLMVDDPVVVGAEQDEVAQRGHPAVGPVGDVVGVAPGRGAVAAGEGAAAVTGDQSPAQPGGHRVGGPADVERLACLAEHYRDHPGVAGDPTGSLRRERTAELQLPGESAQGGRLPGQTSQGLQGDGDGARRRRWAARRRRGRR